jgi:DNA-binding MarR family transcriptional regulator
MPVENTRAVAGGAEETMAGSKPVVQMMRAGGRSACTSSEQSITQAAQSLYRARRRRLQHFPSLERDFGEPVWDVMLDLFVAEREGRPVSITSACVAAAVPLTTALRWIQQLEEMKVVFREPDPTDRRRAHIRLSRSTAAAMESYIRELMEGAAG